MIRHARVDDAAAIAGVQARGWRHAFAELVAAEMMPSPDRQEPRWARHIADGAMVLVWEQDGAVAGFAAVGPAHGEGGGGGEVYAIYVDPPAQGAGVGSALLTRAEAELRRAGHQDAILWTFEGNGLARRFYERHGWRADGGRQVRGEGWDDEVRYRREL